MLAIPSVIKALSKAITIPPEGELFLKSVFTGWLVPSGESLAKRYDDCVTAMSELSPVLSYRLRSKHLIFPWMNHLRHLALQHGDKDVMAMMADMEESITSEYQKVLEELIKNVAWKHGLRTRWEVRQTLNDSDLSLPAGLEEKIKAAILKQAEKDREALEKKSPDGTQGG